jgi:hypothetical protein
MLLFPVVAAAQEFEKYLAEARNAYGVAKLEEARFAMENMLRELDMKIGHDMLKMLPQQLETLKYDPKADNVSGGSASGMGVTITRKYGTPDKQASVDIVNNSPLMAMVSTTLSLPAMMMTDPNQKTVKVGGYKSLLQKQTADDGTVSYDLMIPFNSNLLTFKLNKTTEAEVLRLANLLPLAKIGQMSQ